MLTLSKKARSKNAFINATLGFITTTNDEPESDSDSYEPVLVLGGVSSFSSSSMAGCSHHEKILGDVEEALETKY